MNLYIWEYVEGLTDRYHDGGGVIAAAWTPEEARKAVIEHVREDRVDLADLRESLRHKPDVTLSVVGDVNPRVIIFPDSGCC